MKKIFVLMLMVNSIIAFAQEIKTKAQYDSLQLVKEKLLVERSRIDAEFQDKMNAIAKKSDILSKKYGKKISQKILEGKTWIGMTQNMLIDSQGKDYKVGPSITDASGYYVELKYGSDNIGTLYYLKNNKVISITDY